MSKILLIVALCTMVAVTECGKRTKKLCGRGWEHFCGDETKCVKPMTEFESDKQCITKGGIPGIIACLQIDTNTNSENHGRMCVKDLINGDVGFAKILKEAIKKLDEDEDKLEQEEEDLNNWELMEAN